MRAIYYPIDRIEELQSVLVTGDSAKHLHVVRVKQNEEILVLNGKGLRILTCVGMISKNQIELLIKNFEYSPPCHEFSLAIATPRKEAFEDILKIAVELGVNNIYPLSSEFSQYDYRENERIQRVLESALIQSNNSFMPIIHSQNRLESFLENSIATLFFFNSKIVQHHDEIEKKSGESIVLIGPEGGFSSKEEAWISSRENVFPIHLPTPILRAPTAVAASIGYLLSL